MGIVAPGNGYTGRAVLKVGYNGRRDAKKEYIGRDRSVEGRVHWAWQHLAKGIVGIG